MGANQKKEQWSGVLYMLVTLSIPTIIEEVLATLLQYVDTAMVGRLGEQATASVSVSTTVTWLVNSVPHAIGIGVLALIAKAVGSGDRHLVRRISSQAVWMVLACSILLGGISLLLSPYIPVWVGAEASIQEVAGEYFFIISLPMLFRVSSIVFGAAIRATKDTKTPMLISLGANIINAVLNYALIYGVDMGVRGAAIASAISYVLSGVLMYVAYRRNEWLHWELREIRPDTAILEQCGKVAFPVLGTSITSCLGYTVFAGLVSGMGTTIFAAHSIAVTAEEIFYIPGYGFRTATSTLVGNSLGEQDRDKFRKVSIISVIVTVAMMCVNGVILYLSANILMSFFTPSQAVVDLGADMLRLVAFSEPFFGIMIVMEGIFYGLGNTRYAFIVETFSMWGIRILLTFLCVKVWGLDLRAVWLCMIADNVCKAVLFAIPVMTPKGRSRLFPQF